MTARPLLAERRFAPLFWCQFLSAFNDNLLKNALVFLLLWNVGGEGAGAMVALAGGVFIAPFFLLSGLAGEMADRFDKALLARRLKAAEIGVASWAQYFLKWIVGHPAVTCVIPGTGKSEHIADNVAAGFGALPDQAMRKRMAEYFDSL